jgi:hypothetical protein
MSRRGLAFVCLVALSGAIHLGCSAGGAGRKPITFVQGQASDWRVLEVHDALDAKRAWQTTVDTIALKLDLETLDETSGYIRTSWKVGYGFQPGQAGYTYYKVRALVKFEPSFKRVRIKTEAEFNGLLGYDKRLLEDLYSDVQGRIGRVVK